MMKRVLVFGTFDGFHIGHQFVINEAAKKGTELVVAVARDVHVRALKNKEPQNNEQTRMKRVADDPQVSQAVLSDEELGTYRILDKMNPDVIVLGFDQDELKTDILNWMQANNRNIPVETLDFFTKS